MPADDALVAGHAREAGRRLAILRAALMAEIEGYLRRLATSDGNLVATKEALANARAIRSQVLSLMREEGMPVTIATAEAKAMDAVDAALRGMMPAPSVRDFGTSTRATFEAEARDSIERTVSGLLDEVAGVFRDGAQQMRLAIDRGLNTSAPLESVIEDVRQAMGTTFLQASAAVDMAVRGAGQRVLIDMAERGAEAVGEEVAFLYLGPEDGKTRDFCDRHVGKVYTRAAMKRLDNGTGIPVEVSRGGFNCRHSWSPISIEDAVAEGYEVRR